ncbi:hypothetical protein [Chlorogloea sp. CCALA 695]|nr:hypothetical protein [Chlorogloea sp. CCALA 695]
MVKLDKKLNVLAIYQIKTETKPSAIALSAAFHEIALSAALIKLP